MPLTVQQAEEFFDKMDQNSDGKCTIQEVKKYLQEFCVQHYGSMSDAEFADMVVDWDDDGDKLVSKEEFVNDLTKEARAKKIEKAFAEMDKDGSGKISEDEFRKAMKDNGFTCEKNLSCLFGACDKDGDGQLNLAELRAEMSRSQRR